MRSKIPLSKQRGLTGDIAAMIRMRRMKNIDSHFAEIRSCASDIEERLEDSDCTIRHLKEDNRAYPGRISG